MNIEMPLETVSNVPQILTLADVANAHSQVHQHQTPSIATNAKELSTSSTTPTVRKLPVDATLSNTLTVLAIVNHVRHVIVLFLTAIHVQMIPHVLSARLPTLLMRMVNVHLNLVDYMIQQLNDV